MRKDSVLIVAGFLVFLFPLLGIPHDWKDPALFILGGLTVLIALLYRIEARRREREVHSLAHEDHDPGRAQSASPEPLS
jgi:TRAP-type C4-dicarboxylate transport system permease small subunit